MLLKNESILELEHLLWKEGVFQFVPYKEVLRFSQNMISLFCLKHAFYNLPVLEQVVWLKDNVPLKNSIEIGSGNGYLANELQIKATDSYMQNLPEIKKYYDSLKQPTISYGVNVEKIDALDAVHKYKPEVVLACWVTHKFEEGLKSGNDYGVKEEFILDKTQRYIFIGNEKVHKDKPILKKPHKSYSFPWLISRTFNKDLNRIYVW